MFNMWMTWMCIGTKDIIEQSGKSLFVVAMEMKQSGTSSKQYDRKKSQRRKQDSAVKYPDIWWHVIRLMNSHPWLLFCEVIGSGDRLVTSRVDYEFYWLNKFNSLVSLTTARLAVIPASQGMISVCAIKSCWRTLILSWPWPQTSLWKQRIFLRDASLVRLLTPKKLSCHPTCKHGTFRYLSVRNLDKIVNWSKMCLLAPLGKTEVDP